MGPTRLALSWVCAFACVQVQVQAQVQVRVRVRVRVRELGLFLGLYHISLCSNLGPTGASRASRLS